MKAGTNYLLLRKFGSIYQFQFYNKTKIHYNLGYVINYSTQKNRLLNYVSVLYDHNNVYLNYEKNIFIYRNTFKKYYGVEE